MLVLCCWSVCSGRRRRWIAGAGRGVVERHGSLRRSAHSSGRRPPGSSPRDTTLRQSTSTRLLRAHLRPRRRRRRRRPSDDARSPVAPTPGQRVLRRAMSTAHAASPRRQPAAGVVVVGASAGDVRRSVDARRTTDRRRAVGLVVTERRSTSDDISATNR